MNRKEARGHQRGPTSSIGCRCSIGNCSRCLCVRRQVYCAGHCRCDNSCCTNQRPQERQATPIDPNRPSSRNSLVAEEADDLALPGPSGFRPPVRVVPATDQLLFSSDSEEDGYWPGNRLPARTPAHHLYSSPSVGGEAVPEFDTRADREGRGSPILEHVDQAIGGLRNIQEALADISGRFDLPLEPSDPSSEPNSPSSESSAPSRRPIVDSSNSKANDLSSVYPVYHYSSYTDSFSEEEPNPFGGVMADPLDAVRILMETLIDEQAAN